MNDSYKISFHSIITVLFLLPLFFISATVLPLGIAKIALLGLGSLVVMLSFLYETLKQGRIRLPSNYILWIALALPLVYFLSSEFSALPAASLFGYNLELGTFGSMVFVSIMFGVISIVMTSLSRLFRLYGALLLSLSIVALISFLKVIFGAGFLNFGILTGVMGNTIGAWTDLAVVFGLVSTLCLFAIEMLALKKAYRIFLHVLLAVSVFLLMVINFKNVWQLLFGASVIAVVYFKTFDKRNPESSGRRSKHPVAAYIVAAIALLFMINPVVSATKGNIGNYVSSMFGVANSDIRPSLATTLDVSKKVLAQKPLVGSGPNTFAADWLMYKPQIINNTPFWNTAFPYGFGYIPTQIATTGILGSIVWILLLVGVLMLGVKAFAKSSWNPGERFLVLASFMSTLYLILALWLYIPSIVILALTFIFVGLSVAAAHTTGLIGTKEIHFAEKAAWNFGAVLLTVVLGIGALGLGLVTFQRLVAVTYFEKVVALSNTPGTTVDAIELELSKAANLSDQDLYFSTLSQIEFARAQSVLTNTVDSPEKNKLAFENSVSRSIAGAQSAVNQNPSNYQNWVALGSLYAALVPKPIAIPGAYDRAKQAFGEALKLNPESPEIPLILARLELDNGNVDLARKHIQEAITKKPDYADAYFFLTQLEASLNNIPQAIASAETLSLLTPTNPGVFFELGLLKYAKKDYNGAIDAFVGALKIVPEYANAKYYLGLSLDAMNRRADAILVFEDLLKTNQDNAIIQQILTNLKAGHDPFSKSTSKATLPIPTSTR